MQTKKKHLGRNGARELPSCKSNRQQKKVTEPTHIAEKKAADLITSSARKQRFVGIISKKNRDAAKNPTVGHIFAGDETQNICSAYKTIDMASTDHKGCKERSVQCGLDTIFSPAFHISKDVGCIITSRGDVVEFFGDVVQQESVQNMMTEVSTCPSNRGVDSFTMHSEYCDLKNDPAPTFSRYSDTQCNEKDNVAVNLSSEVSAIYLAMQQSKLECVDEASQDSMSIEACAEAEDAYDDFDPYLFIKNLPELTAVVPAFRTVLLPKQTRSCPPTTLVLDLDETLVHSTLEHCEDVDFTFPVTLNLKEHTVYVRCRPHLKDFMERVASLFEIIIFTASQSIYAEQLLNVLDPKRRIFRHRVYRESCVFVDGNYIKDLSVLGRDLAHVIIIDNSPQAFGFQVDNGIPIESWFDDRSDQALLSLLPFLESLAAVEDVRPLIAKKFNLREKVAAAIDPSLNFNNRTPFDW